MSVVIRDSQGKILLLTKGADSILYPRLKVEKSPALKDTEEFVE